MLTDFDEIFRELSKYIRLLTCAILFNYLTDLYLLLKQKWYQFNLDTVYK